MLCKNHVNFLNKISLHPYGKVQQILKIEDFLEKSVIFHIKSVRCLQFTWNCYAVDDRSRILPKAYKIKILVPTTSVASRASILDTPAVLRATGTPAML